MYQEILEIFAVNARTCLDAMDGLLKDYRKLNPQDRDALQSEIREKIEDCDKRIEALAGHKIKLDRQIDELSPAALRQLIDGDPTPMRSAKLCIPVEAYTDLLQILIRIRSNESLLAQRLPHRQRHAMQESLAGLERQISSMSSGFKEYLQSNLTHKQQEGVAPQAAGAAAGAGGSDAKQRRPLKPNTAGWGIIRGGKNAENER